MPIIVPEIEIVDRSTSSVHYLEHGWPTSLCRWHAHDEYELHLIIETRGRVFVGDYIGSFAPGSLFLTGPRLPHNWVTSEEDHDPVALRDMLIQFHHDGLVTASSAYPEFRELNGLLDASHNGVEILGFDSREAHARLVEIRESNGLKRVLLTLDFLHRLSRWPDRKTLSVARVANRSSFKNHSRIAMVIEYVVAHYAEDLALPKLAAMAGMSDSAFSRSFHATTGNRFTEFVNRVRVGQACVKLHETDDRISSICYDVGFQNIANFNRQFMKIKGMTPGAFRSELPGGGGG